MKKLLLGMAVALAANAYGVTINLTNINCGNTGTDETDPSDPCYDLTQEINSAINEDIPSVSMSEYATGIANSTSFAYKGMTSDYSDNYDLFMVRGMVGLAAEGDIEDLDNTTKGVGIGAAATVGVNLDVLPIDKVGPVELSKLDVMFSIMSQKIDNDMIETLSGTTMDQDVDVDVSSFALMLRYRLIDEISFFPGSLLTWGGVHLHTGFHYASFEGTMSDNFEDQTVDSGSATASLSGILAKFDIKSSTMTIPVEVSTYLRAGYVFTLFGGAGFDLVSGSTDVSLDAGGTISGTNGATYSADANANESDSGDADPTNFRAFGGIQINLPVVRLTIQANKGLGNDLFGVATGVKIDW